MGWWRSGGAGSKTSVAQTAEHAEGPGLTGLLGVALGHAGAVAFHRAGEFGYHESPTFSGIFTTSAPAPLRLDLDALGE